MINVQADDSRYYDARNKASHEVAKKLVKVIAAECLPYICLLYTSDAADD